MTKKAFKNQLGIAKTDDPMRAQNASISSQATLKNPKEVTSYKRDKIEEHIDIEIEIDFPSKPNVNQVTNSFGSSFNRFRLAVDQFLKHMRKGDHDVYYFLVIGCLHIQRGLLTDAIGFLRYGLHATGITDREKVAILYQLGKANKKLKNFSEATYYYYRVHRMSPNYRSVTRRLLVIPEFSEATNTLMREETINLMDFF